ncbi:MAG: hypothetical protein KatS3mg031_2938 [Chitinophagales bacterium]|nr:MAG: hypothetical protein KatS3mg031_2938 [Chitinophagales bacterium]
MKLSKLNPVRFFVNGKQVPEHIKDGSYAQPFKNTDIIQVQLADEDIRGYFLEIVKNGIVIQQLPFTRYPYGNIYVYHVGFQPITYGLTGIFNLRIVTEDFTLNGLLQDSDDISGQLSTTVQNFSITGSITENDDITGNITVPQYSEGIFGLSPSPCLYLYTLYWQYNTAWGTGVTMYTNPELTNILSSDFTTITKADIGEIYNISNGVVGTTTGSFC